MRKFTALLIAICMLLAANCVRADGERAQIGTDVSGFYSFDIYGVPVTGSVFHSKTVSAVTYWATWSPACVAQLEILQQIADAHPERGVFGLLWVDATSTVEAAREIMEQNGYTFPVFVCDDVWQRVADQSTVIPQSFIVNSEGVIVEVWHAAFSSAEILDERLAFWASDPVAPQPDGDADLNGVIDSADALHVLRCVVGAIVPDEECILHSDMNGNGALDSGDALLILRMVLLG